MNVDTPCLCGILALKKWGERKGENMARLTDRGVRALDRPGKYGDGGGLYLNIARGGSKSWLQRVTVDGKRREIGLGGYPAVTLAQARRRAANNKAAVADGRDPLADKRRPGIPTFEEAAIATHKANLPRWREGRYGKIWLGTLERHAYPKIGNVRVDRIDRADVLAVLHPIWTAKPEMGRRVRERMRTTFKYCQAHGWLDYNPAGEAIDGALPPMPRVKAHLRALPYDDVPAALQTIDESTAGLAAKLCVRFVILTAARSGEARGARWDEIDFDAWTVPGERMKTGREHRVPLSDAALDVLARARALYDGSGLVFPSPTKEGRPLSDMTMTKILRTTGLADRATVHGFRTSFKTWTMEQTATPWAVGEAALSHVLGNSVEAAYARTDLYDRRRELMNEWAAFVTGASVSTTGHH